ncbi:hypothetical protein OF83DRAFT_1180000 [Amylostereum chailletii]|nr:hypothetical protein OF83DRAFT_1180000 [Amylostereum chailletii]
MAGVSNLFLDSKINFTWRNASIVVAKAQGHGVKHARNLRQWILNFIRYDQLPLHQYGQTRWTVLEDEDISQDIQLQLMEKAKAGFIKAADVVEIVASPEMQAKFKQIGVCKPSISERMARRWLGKLKWRDARVVFKAGKNREGWFSAEDLLAQVDRAIDVFEGKTKGFAQGLFLFDNAPSH